MSKQNNSQLTLKDFISQSLNEIMDGVVEAQKHAKEVNGIVNPHIKIIEGNPYIDEDADDIDKNLTTLDFDIAVTVGDDDKLQGGLGIFAAALGVGVKGEIIDRSETISRIKFQIFTSLPPQK